VIGDRLFCFAASQVLSLSVREAGIGAFLDAGHFSFAFFHAFLLTRLARYAGSVAYR
jgi:hypothetical protein